MLKRGAGQGTTNGGGGLSRDEARHTGDGGGKLLKYFYRKQAKYGNKNSNSWGRLIRKHHKA